MAVDREKRFLYNSKSQSVKLQTGYPPKNSGTNGDERIVKTSDGKLRLYRKELGSWYYIDFTRS